LAVQVVVDPDFPFAGTESLQAAGVLYERALPGHGHREEERVQPAVVEALADEPSGGKDDTLLGGRNVGELRSDLPVCLGRQTTAKHHDVPHGPTQAFREVLEL